MKLKIVDKLKGLETADEKDVLLLQGVAFHDGVNKNNAVIFKEDAKKDINTIVGKPLRVLWDGKPTGHGYDPITGTFDGKVKNIGYIHNAYIEDKGGQAYDAIVEGVVWKKYYPEIANAMVELHEENNLNFSIEAEREVQMLENGERRCYNNDFMGLSLVEHPAWSHTKSFMVAEDESATNDTQNEVEGNTEPPVASDGQSKEPVKPQVEQPKPLEPKVAQLEKTGGGENDSSKLLEEQIEALNKRVQQFEIKEKGTQRLERLSKYITPSESVEELGRLSETEYVAKLEEALSVYASELEKKVPKDKRETTYVNTITDSGVKTNLDNRETLLGIMSKLI